MSTLNLVCVGDFIPNLSLVLETKTLLDHFIALHENTLEVKSHLVAPERKFNETSPYQLVEPGRPGFTGSATGREKSTCACKFFCPLLCELITLMTFSPKVREVVIKNKTNVK